MLSVSINRHPRTSLPEEINSRLTGKARREFDRYHKAAVDYSLSCLDAAVIFNFFCHWTSSCPAKLDRTVLCIRGVLVRESVAMPAWHVQERCRAFDEVLAVNLALKPHEKAGRKQDTFVFLLKDQETPYVIKRLFLPANLSLFTCFHPQHCDTWAVPDWGCKREVPEHLLLGAFDRPMPMAKERQHTDYLITMPIVACMYTVAGPRRTGLGPPHGPPTRNMEGTEAVRRSRSRL